LNKKIGKLTSKYSKKRKKEQIFRNRKQSKMVKNIEICSSEKYIKII